MNTRITQPTAKPSGGYTRSEASFLSERILADSLSSFGDKNTLSDDREASSLHVTVKTSASLKAPSTSPSTTQPSAEESSSTRTAATARRSSAQKKSSEKVAATRKSAQAPLQASSAKAPLAKALACVLSLALMLPLASCIAVAEAGTEGEAAETTVTQPATLPALESGIDTSKTAEIESKSEVIYGLLSYDGSIDEAYAINRFRLASEGSFTDYGAYDWVENLTNTEAIASSGDEVTLASLEGDYYYQGKLSAPKLPWQIAVTYSLDGNAVAPSEINALAGQSGRLGIHIATSKTEGIDSRFFEHYTLQITITLPSDRIDAISAEGATIAAAGSDTQVSYVVLPESDGSLDFSVDFTDIEMAGISIAAVPYGMEFDFPDTSGISSELTQLVSAIAELRNGTQQISSGASQAASGLEQLAAGSNQTNNGLAGLGQSSGELSAGSSQLSSNLAQTVGGLNQMTSDPGFQKVLSVLPQETQQQFYGMIYGLQGLSDGYTQFDAGLQQYLGGVSELAAGYPALNNGLSASASGVRALSNGAAELGAGTNELYSGVQNMPEEMQKQIDEFAAAYDYSGFEPTSYISEKNSKVVLVQFVLTTPAIELPEVTEDIEEIASESSILDKIIALFTGE